MVGTVTGATVGWSTGAASGMVEATGTLGAAQAASRPIASTVINRRNDVYFATVILLYDLDVPASYQKSGANSPTAGGVLHWSSGQATAPGTNIAGRRR